MPSGLSKMNFARTLGGRLTLRDSPALSRTFTS